jgi:hypothetical protein
MKQSHSIYKYFVANTPQSRRHPDLKKTSGGALDAGKQYKQVTEYFPQNTSMSGSTDDNLGRRLFQVQKEKAVEEAFEKLRRGLSAQWNSISSTDSEILKEVLGEVWTSIDRHRWGTYRFSKVSAEDLKSLIVLGKEMKSQYSPTYERIRQLDEILGRAE